ncbi:MAG TPA: response regulator [Candidatus Limnocylindrales bacterium]|nr:response regulator [Candidatus Limnocylindrales bacterium]
MAGEPILIIDDTPVNLKLTRILLVNEGYKVITAASAEEGLELLRGMHPALILADIQLPGMDGLEFTRRIKSDPATKNIPIIALTAFAMKGDEQKAIDAGCDGYITKPIDTRTLGARIREVLGRAGADAVPAATPPEKTTIDKAEMMALRRRFLAEGQEISRNLLLDLDGAFPTAEAKRSIHQWIGTGGLLGYNAISRLAREAEALLMEPPLDSAQFRETLTNLVMAFNSPREARDVPIPEPIVQMLSGKRVAAVGFAGSVRERLSISLERVGATPVFLQSADRPESPAAAGCALAVVYVDGNTPDSPWLSATPPRGMPLVFCGDRDVLLGLDPRVQSSAREFLMDSWLPDEALVRLSLALSHRPAEATRGSVAAAPAAPAAAAAMPVGRPQIVIADDDPTVLALVRAAIENFGMECVAAHDGSSAAETIRRIRPQAAVLDVNMPGMDGYEVLSAIRAEGLPVRVVLLTARQQESDVIRGFTLGADDYIVKPFSPMELVARVKRLLGR